METIALETGLVGCRDGNTEIIDRVIINWPFPCVPMTWCLGYPCSCGSPDFAVVRRHGTRPAEMPDNPPVIFYTYRYICLDCVKLDFREDVIGEIDVRTMVATIYSRPRRPDLGRGRFDGFGYGYEIPYGVDREDIARLDRGYRPEPTPLASRNWGREIPKRPTRRSPPSPDSRPLKGFP